MKHTGRMIDYLARVHSGASHAGGKRSTSFLLARFDFHANDNVLEIGFGTGATLVKAAGRFPSAKFYGVEASEAMYRAAKARMKFSRAEKNIELQLSRQLRQLSFPDHFFDSVYAESVLGIQEKNALAILVAEISRVLKPGGKLFLNETVWLDHVSQEEAERINARGKEISGMIQSNSDFPYQKTWEALLDANGLSVISTQPADAISEGEIKTWSVPVFLSEIFTRIGRMKKLLFPSLRRQRSYYLSDPARAIKKDRPYLQGIIFIAQKQNAE